MTHQDKVSFIDKNMVTQHYPYDGSNPKPYGISGLAARLGVTMDSLVIGGPKSKARADKLYEYVHSALELGFKKEHLSSLLDESLNEDTEPDVDCRASLGNYVNHDEMSLESFKVVLMLSLRILKSKEGIDG